MTEDDKISPESETAPKGTSFKERAKDKKEKSRPLTKIVCRRLPPSMTEESFLEQVAPIPEHDYFYFAKPDYTLTPDIFSRAYINFVNVEDIYLFRDKFDEYIFLDEKGNEYPAIVEYAPFQRLPKKRRKKDPRSGTIESDVTYLEFLESLKETDSDSREPKMEYSYQITEEKKETTTPLLEFLAARRREEKRRKEERQRRRTRNRNTKDDDIFEEDVKKIKPRDSDKPREIEKTPNKKRDEDASVNKSENVDAKESKYPIKGGKNFREQRKSIDDRKKSEYDKKDYNKGKDLESVSEEKGNRRERRDRQREPPKERVKEVKKYSDSRKDKLKPSDKKGDKLPSFRQIDENEQNEIISLTVENKFSQKNPSTSENTKAPTKAALVSSNIKPFTQLPQYKAEDLNKVIEELDKIKLESLKTDLDSSSQNIHKDKISESKINKPTVQPIPTNNVADKKTEFVSKVSESGESNTKDMDSSNSKVLDRGHSVPENVKSSDDHIETTDSSQQPRRSSLESSEIKTAIDDTPLRRHKSLDDKSHDIDDRKEMTYKEKSSEPRKERRIRNKDRPSIVIYQPGMGKFSKQRLAKDSPTGTYKPLDPNAQSSSKTASESSDKSAES